MLVGIVNGRIMCTHPLQINRVNQANGHCDIDVVPCGKCAECLCLAQANFAALSTLEAQASGSVHFVTLTYNNRTVPIMVSDPESGLRVFADSRTRLFYAKMCASNGSLVASVHHDQDVCPSLCRKDFRLFLKRVRVKWQRNQGLDSPPVFRYSAFGEYGGQTFRPHYHVLFYDADKKFVDFLAAEWESQFGYSDVKFIPKVNKDGSPGYVKVSKYISKYVSKPKFDNPWIMDGLCEPPSLEDSLLSISVKMVSTFPFFVPITLEKISEDVLDGKLLRKFLKEVESL